MPRRPRRLVRAPSRTVPPNSHQKARRSLTAKRPRRMSRRRRAPPAAERQANAPPPNEGAPEGEEGMTRRVPRPPSSRSIRAPSARRPASVAGPVGHPQGNRRAQHGLAPPRPAARCTRRGFRPRRPARQSALRPRPPRVQRTAQLPAPHAAKRPRTQVPPSWVRRSSSAPSRRHHLRMDKGRLPARASLASATTLP